MSAPQFDSIIDEFELRTNQKNILDEKLKNLMSDISAKDRTNKRYLVAIQELQAEIGSYNTEVSMLSDQIHLIRQEIERELSVKVRLINFLN